MQIPLITSRIVIIFYQWPLSKLTVNLENHAFFRRLLSRIFNFSQKEWSESRRFSRIWSVLRRWTSIWSTVKSGMWWLRRLFRSWALSGRRSREVPFRVQCCSLRPLLWALGAFIVSSDDRYLCLEVEIAMFGRAHLHSRLWFWTNSSQIREFPFFS